MRFLLIFIITVFLSASAAADDIYRIGVFGNSTSAIASAAFNTVELMAEEYNNTYTAKKVEAVFFYEDDENVKNQIKGTSNILALIGCFGDRHQDMLNDINEIPLISICSQMQGFTEKNNTFRVCASEAQLAQAQARIDAAIFGRRKFAVIYEEGNDEYLKMAEAYVETINANKCIITQLRSVKPDRTDFSNILVFLRDKKTRVLYYIGSYENAARIAKQSKKLNVGAIMTSNSNIFTKDFVKRAKLGAEGGEFVTKRPPSLWKLKDFVPFFTRYNKKYDNASKYIPYAHDAAGAVIDAFDNGKIDKNDVREYLKTIEFSGANGKMSFDEQGNRDNPPFYMYVIRRGTFWSYKINGKKRLKYDNAK